MIKRSGTYLLIEERLKAPLDHEVRSRRADGDSWNAIAVALHESTGVLVTPETLRNWFREQVPA